MIPLTLRCPAPAVPQTVRLSRIREEVYPDNILTRTSTPDLRESPICDRGTLNDGMITSLVLRWAVMKTTFILVSDQNLGLDIIAAFWHVDYKFVTGNIIMCLGCWVLRAVPTKQVAVRSALWCIWRTVHYRTGWPLRLGLWVMRAQIRTEPHSSA